MPKETTLSDSSVMKPSNKKKVWRFVNTAIRGKRGRTPLVPDLLDLTPTQINRHFARIGENTIESNIGTVDPEAELPPRSPATFTEFTVRDSDALIEILRSLGEHKALGHGGIPNRLLKDSKTVMYLAVLSVIRKVFQSRVFPKELKISSLRPIHKSRTYSDILNFRPISLFSSINKIIEKVIPKQMIEFQEKNSLLGEYKYGFHRRRSCEDAAYQLLSPINEADDMGMSSIAKYLLRPEVGLRCSASRKTAQQTIRVGFAEPSMDLLRNYPGEPRSMLRKTWEPPQSG